MTVKKKGVLCVLLLYFFVTVPGKLSHFGGVLIVVVRMPAIFLKYLSTSTACPSPIIKNGPLLIAVVGLLVRLYGLFVFP